MGGKASEVGNSAPAKRFVLEQPHKVRGDALLTVFRQNLRADLPEKRAVEGCRRHADNAPLVLRRNGEDIRRAFVKAEGVLGNGKVNVLFKLVLLNPLGT